MSIKDELARAEKERNEASKQHAKDVKQTREFLKGRLDSIFSDFSLQMQSRNQWFIDMLISLNAVNLLDDLRSECNLVYETRRVSQEKKGIFGNSNYVFSEHNIPAMLDINLRSAAYNFDGNWRKLHNEKSWGMGGNFSHPLSYAVQHHSIVDCPKLINPKTATDLHSALADYKLWESFKVWSKVIMSEWEIIDNFPKAIKDFEDAINFLEIPPLESIHAQLRWNLKIHSSSSEYGNDWETYDQVSVNITPQVVEVRRDNGEKVSTSVDNCTSNWVKQQIANVYVNFGRL